MYPSENRYSKDHEWLRIEGDVCVMGITHYAQGELGEVVYVDLPEVGDTFAAGDAFGAIDSSKTSADVYTPLPGEVTEVNTALEDAPETINDEPHGGGWLIKLRFSSKEGYDDLMTAEQYQEHVASQE